MIIAKTPIKHETKPIILVRLLQWVRLHKELAPLEKDKLKN